MEGDRGEEGNRRGVGGGRIKGERLKNEEETYGR